MGKDISTLKSQKPQWIGVDEPVSASTNPANQDATVQSDGTIIHNVEGVDNRCEAHLWGLVKLLADIVDLGHGNDGSHALVNSDIASDADIAETKLDMSFKGMDRPDSGTFSSTSDIVTVLRELWPYRELSVKNALFNRNNKQNVVESLSGIFTSYFEDPKKVSMSGPQNTFLFADDEILRVGDTKIRVYGVNSEDGECKFDLGTSQGVTGVPSYISQCSILTLQIFTHDIEGTGYAFPYGNIHYMNTSASSGDHGINFDHSDQVIAVTDESFEDFVENPDNNVYYDKNSNLVQTAYIVGHDNIDYSNYKWGMDDPTFSAVLGDDDVYTSELYPGSWIADNETYGRIIIVPIAIIARRNVGIYDKILNPGGSSLKRSTIGSISSFTECFNNSNIIYANSGTECPDYPSADYDISNDIYTLDGTTYYRSGKVLSGLSINYEGSTPGYCDHIYNTIDVLNLKKQKIDFNEALPMLEQLILAGKCKSNLITGTYGVASNISKNTYFSNKPKYLFGFANSETEIFGSANTGGIFVDQGNNGVDARTDGVRKYWTDKDITSRVPFSFTSGSSSSEDKPNLFTYEPISRTVTLNTDALSGDPSITPNFIPYMTWANGDLVILSTSWSGLGTNSASCIIDVANHSSHNGQKIYGLCSIDYGKGNGTPFNFDEVLSVTDIEGNTYDTVYVEDTNHYANFAYDGVTDTSSTTTTIYLSETAYNDDDYYNDMYITILSTGDTRRIVDYEGDTRGVVLESAISEAPTEGVQVTICKLENPAAAHIVIDRNSRGILGSLRRSRKLVDSNGVVILDNPILAYSKSSGGVAPIYKGSVLTSLPAGEYVDVIYEDEDPFLDGFIVEGFCTPQVMTIESVDSTDKYYIKHVGNIFSTNIGTANNPDESYLKFIPGCTLPAVDDVKWVGSVDGGYTAIMEPMKTIPWTQIMPFEGATLDIATMTVELSNLNELPELKSLSQVVDPSSGCFAGFMLVQSKNTGRDLIVVSVRHHGSFGFTAQSNLFKFEINKFYAIRK